MTEVLATTNAGNSVMIRMAETYGVQPQVMHDVILKTCMPSGKPPTNEQFAAFCIVADAHQLNPMLKEIYAFPAKGGGIVPMISCDGWYKIANRHPKYDGHEQDVVHDEELGLGIKTTLHIKGRSSPVIHTEWKQECYRATEPWKQMPMRMLGHKSFMQTARQGLSISGVYDEDEAKDIIEAEHVQHPAEGESASGVAGLRARTQSMPKTNIEVPMPACKPARDEKPVPEVDDPSKDAVTIITAPAPADPLTDSAETMEAADDFEEVLVQEGLPAYKAPCVAHTRVERAEAYKQGMIAGPNGKMIYADDEDADLAVAWAQGSESKPLNEEACQSVCSA